MPPEKFGRYKIERKLGEGGMGVVYEASDPLLGRRLAIKVMKAGIAADENVRQRFFREAKAVAGLDHKNIVAIYDMGGGEDKEHLPFIVMEYVEGDDLESLHEEGGLPLENKLVILAQVARGLHHAHSKNVVHRDLKPANIRVGEKQAKILDFGVARIAESTVITQSGMYIGTLPYSSPEHFGVKDIDGRSDLFSLGVILYELITGEKPFPGPPFRALMYQICQEKHPSIEKHLPGCDPELVELVDRALAKDREQRFQSGAEMAEALEAFKAKLPEKRRQAEERLRKLEDELSQLQSDFGTEALAALSPDDDWMRELAALGVSADDTVAYQALPAELPEDYTELLKACARYREKLDELNSRETELGRLSKLFAKSREQFERRQWKPCLKTVEEILEDYPESEVAANRRKLCQERLEELRNIEQTIEEGRQALAKGQIEGALEKAESVLALAPQDSRALELREQAAQTLQVRDQIAQARQRLEEGDFESAIESANEGLASAPDNEQLASLKQEAERGLQLRKARAEILGKANAAAREGQWARVEELAAAGLESHPQDQDLLKLKSQAEERLAEEKRLEGLRKKAQGLYAERKLDAVLEVCGEIQEIDESDSEGLALREKARGLLDAISKAEAALTREDFPAAVKQAEAGLEIDADHPKLRSLREKALEEQEKRAQAEASLEEARQDLKAERLKAALKAAQQGLQAIPGHSGLLEVAERARKAIQLRERVESLLDQARSQIEQGAYQEALRSAEGALEIQDPCPPAAKLAEQARAELERASLVENMIEAAREAAGRGDFEAALKAAREGLEAAPDNSALEKLRKDAEAEIERRERIEQLLQKANSHFEDENFSKVLSLSGQIIELAPEHGEAQKLQKQAQDALERLRTLEQLLDQARKAEEAEDFKTALETARRGLEVDSQNSALAEIRDRAQARLEELETAEKRVADAEDHLARGRLADARKALQEALELVPEHEKASELSAQVEERIERRKQADGLFRKAKGQAGRKQWEDCRETVRQGLELDSEHEGLQALEEQAAAALERANKIRKLVEKAENALGNDQAEQALDAAEKALEMEAGHERAAELAQEAQSRLERRRQVQRLFNKARGKLEGEPDAALELASQGLEIDPEHTELQELAGRARELKARAEELGRLRRQAEAELQSGAFQGALQLAERILKLDARSEAGARLKEEAREGLQKLEKIKAHASSARERKEQGDPDACLEQAEAGLRLDSSHEELQSLHEWAEKAIRERRGKVEKLLQSSRDAAQKERFEQALEKARSALRLEPGHEEASQLAEECRQAIEEREKRARAEELLEKARAAEKDDDLQACVAALGEAVELLPEDKDLRQYHQRVSREHRERSQREERRQRIQRLMANSRRLAKSGNPAKALKLLDELLSLDSRHVQAKRLRRQCRNQLRARRRRLAARASAAAAIVVVLAAAAWWSMSPGASVDVVPPEVPVLMSARQVQPGESEALLEELAQHWETTVEEIRRSNGFTGDPIPGQLLASSLPEQAVPMSVNIRPWAWVEKIERKSDGAVIRLENKVAAPLTIHLTPGEYILTLAHDEWGQGQVDMRVPDSPPYHFTALHPRAPDPLELDGDLTQSLGDR